MEVIDDPNHAGKLLVLFNGTQLSCYHDTDCPGAGICAINQTWAWESGGHCMCNTKNGLTGLDCDEWCGEAVAVLVINLLASIIAAIATCLSIYLLASIMRHKLNRRITPVVITLMFTGIGSICFLIGAILSAMSALGFPSLYIVVEIQGRLLRRMPQAFDYAVFVLFTLAFCISLCSIVILPLTWIDIAKRSLVLKKSQTSLVIGWSIVSVLVVLAMELPFCILSIERFRTEGLKWSLAVSIGYTIIFTSVFVLNSIALILITRIKRTQESSGMTAGMLNFMRRIQISSFQLAITSVLSVGFAFFYYLRMKRGVYDDPRCAVDGIDVAFRCSQFTVLYSVMVAIWFVAPSAYSLRESSAITEPSSASKTKAATTNISPEASRQDVTVNDETTTTLADSSSSSLLSGRIVQT